MMDYLTCSINLDIFTYQPYRKPDNNPVYLNKNPNLPTTVLKLLPKLIEKCISDISHNKCLNRFHLINTYVSRCFT